MLKDIPTQGSLRLYLSSLINPMNVPGGTPLYSYRKISIDNVKTSSTALVMRRELVFTWLLFHIAFLCFVICEQNLISVQMPSIQIDFACTMLVLQMQRRTMLTRKNIPRT